MLNDKSFPLKGMTQYCFWNILESELLPLKGYSQLTVPVEQGGRGWPVTAPRDWSPALESLWAGGVCGLPYNLHQHHRWRS